MERPDDCTAPYDPTECQGCPDIDACAEAYAQKFVDAGQIAEGRRRLDSREPQAGESTQFRAVDAALGALCGKVGRHAGATTNPQPER